MKKALFLLLLLMKTYPTIAGPDTLIVSETGTRLVSHNFFTQIAADTAQKLTINDILKRTDFTASKPFLPTLKLSNSVIWLKIILKNKTAQPYIAVSAGATVIVHFDAYFVKPETNQVMHIQPVYPDTGIGLLTPKETVVNFNIMPDSAQTVYIRIQSIASGIIPIKIYSANQYWKSYTSKNTAFGIFTGIVIIMIFYNLFLFFIVKDKSYLYYVSYIIILSISQGLLHGYGLNVTDSLTFNNFVIPIVRVLFWLSILLFVNEFLQLKNQHERVYKYYSVLYYTSALPLLFVISGYTPIAYSIISLNAAFVSIILLILGIWFYLDGVKHAKFFILAWSLFLISVLISIARNKDILPYNDYTSNIILLGAALELVIFSIALADKINFYRDQNNQSQLFALKIAKENEKLITEQNIQLENKVLERTKELLESNRNLMGLVTNLETTQTQLIDTEKMASLGQLTAGIAHEINNPINFVKSNIKPLRLDFKDIFELLNEYDALEKNIKYRRIFKRTINFKRKIDLNFISKEINDLLNGIEEGAARTAEIIQSLRAFSRTDEVELKPTDINKSILNSLVLLRSTIPYYIEITPVFDKIGTINCYPGKLNQVFMNLIHNSIQAIKEKKKHQKESILIVTKNYPDNITIEITDSGVGMTEEIKQKMFDPFFTTKTVGEGTGLGLSIVFGIIEKHKGAIDVKSKPGKGTTIIIMLPKTLN